MLSWLLVTSRPLLLFDLPSPGPHGSVIGCLEGLEHKAVIHLVCDPRENTSAPGRQ